MVLINRVSLLHESAFLLQDTMHNTDKLKERFHLAKVLKRFSSRSAGAKVETWQKGTILVTFLIAETHYQTLTT